MDTRESSYKESLVQAGLTQDQSGVYEILVKHGALQASRAASLAHISRPLCYKVLDELQALGLVEKKDEPKKVAVFSPAHPLALKTLVDKRFEAAQGSKAALESVLGSMVSQFNTMSGQPGIRVLEGVAGIAELYEDILNERQSLLLMRSYLDDTRPELAQMVAQQIKDQARLRITTRAITPPEEVAEEEWRGWDKAGMVERRVISGDAFDIPAQVIVYAGKVAITAYEGHLITTIIENAAIKTTFSVMFEYMWNAAGKPLAPALSPEGRGGDPMPTVPTGPALA